MEFSNLKHLQSLEAKRKDKMIKRIFPFKFISLYVKLSYETKPAKTVFSENNLYFRSGSQIRKEEATHRKFQYIFLRGSTGKYDVIAQCLGR